MGKYYLVLYVIAKCADPSTCASDVDLQWTMESRSAAMELRQCTFSRDINQAFRNYGDNQVPGKKFRYECVPVEEFE